MRLYLGSGPRLQVSWEGGTEPRWGPDGKELFYVNGQILKRVAIATTPKLSAAGAQKILEGPYLFHIGSPGVANYGIARDGQRFLLIKPADAGPALSSLTVVLGGFEAWRRR